MMSPEEYKVPVPAAYSEFIRRDVGHGRITSARRVVIRRYGPILPNAPC